MIDLTQYDIFNRNLSDLKTTSIDTSKTPAVYMTDSTLSAINFDEVKNEYVKPLGLSEVPKSNDALFATNDGTIIFVEFKGGVMSENKKFGVRKKIYDSVLIFCDIVSEKISTLRNCAEYILVYNEDVNSAIESPEQPKVQQSSSYDNIVQSISGLAKTEHVRFGVNIFKNYCFKNVHTYTKAEFKNFLSTL